ncbi:MAG: NRDE family protein, partial [Candidatus Eremiobacteraeota bacterium]|nr:NRDE family protein [Candidatus Eremiobacteraeota bacterium]
MCTVLVLLRPGDSWPLLLASNRDERLDRPFDPPGRWWPEAPGVTGWRDATAGGSWLAVNDAGTVATIVNGMHELGPAPGKASRGELVVQLLTKRGAVGAADAPCSAGEAAEAARRLDPARYRRFALLVADRETTFVATCD